MVVYIGKSLIYKEWGGEVDGKDSKQSPQCSFNHRCENHQIFYLLETAFSNAFKIFFE